MRLQLKHNYLSVTTTETTRKTVSENTTVIFCYRKELNLTSSFVLILLTLTWTCTFVLSDEVNNSLQLTLSYSKVQYPRYPCNLPQLMSEEIEMGTQTIDSSSQFVELGLGQETEMGPTVDETPADEFTFKSVGEKIKPATDPILRKIEEPFSLLASRTEMESAGKSEASGSRRNREYSSPSRNRYDIFNLFLLQNFHHKNSPKQLQTSELKNDRKKPFFYSRIIFLEETYY